jgi:hypothetical protein
MKELKKAFERTKYEMNRSRLSICLVYLVTAVFLAKLIIHLSSYLEEGTILYDFFFVILFGAAPLVPKRKEFEAQHIHESFIRRRCKNERL